MFGFKTKTENEGGVALEEATLSKKAQEQLEKERKEAEEAIKQKEFDAVKSICLECENAWVYAYIPGPQDPDPLIVECHQPMVMGYNKIHRYERNRPECYDDQWRRKCTKCSYFKQKS